MTLKEQLLAIKLHKSEHFDKSLYQKINTLICQTFKGTDNYFTMKSEGDKVKVTRINKGDRVIRRKEMLAMQVNEQLIEKGDHYRPLHVTISKLNRQALGKWAIVKDGDVVIIKREG